MNNTIQQDTWQWGTGQHSMRGRTRISKGDSETTSGVYRVHYFHPLHKRVMMLAILWEDLLGEGTVDIKEDSTLFAYTLSYPTEPTRDLQIL